MIRLASRLAPGILTLILWLSANPSAYSQQLNDSNRVVSVVEDSADKFLLLSTAALKPLPPPNIRYLPGNDADTILIADFPGVVCEHPARLFAPNVPGVRVVRVDQAQSNPPVCRISIDTSQPELMHQLAFLARPGTLMLKWPIPYQPRQPLAPPPAPFTAAPPKPQLQQSQIPELHAQAGHLLPQPDKGPFARPDKTNSFSQQQKASGFPRTDKTSVFAQPEKASAFPRIDKTSVFAQPEKASAFPRIDKTSVFAQPDKTSEFPKVGPMVGQGSDCAPVQPTIQLWQKSPLRIDIAAHRPFSYQSFRLHAPERYVIDTSDLPELASCTPPQVASGSLLNGVRVGHPDNDETRSRLVLDLADATVKVKEIVDQAGHALSIVVDKLSYVPANPDLPLKMPPGTTIVLDAGHGGSDPGAQRGDVQEKEITLDIAEKLRKRLAQAGARITMTRGDDTFVSLQDRVALANQLKPNLFLSVHINSLETNSSISGIETYYQTDQSKALAECVHNCLLADLGVPDRGVRQARFYVIKYTSMPAILAEVGFISNKAERDKLISSDYQAKVADALARGVMLYLSGRAEPLPQVNSQACGTMIEPVQSQRSTAPLPASCKPMSTGIQTQSDSAFIQK